MKNFDYCTSVSQVALLKYFIQNLCTQNNEKKKNMVILLNFRNCVNIFFSQIIFESLQWEHRKKNALL